jgi:peptidoglycan-N-acetylglucosamine deacetylase
MTHSTTTVADGALESGWGPDAKRGAVSFTFDNLGEAADLEFGMWPTDVPIGAHYTVAKVVPALLKTLSGMSVTFFTEAWNAEVYPDTLRSMVGAGHEVGLHGWRHELWSKLDVEMQESVLARSVVAMSAIGLKPRGFRPPGGAGSANLPTLLKGHGMIYISEVGQGDRVEEGIARVPFPWSGVDGVYLQPELGKAVGISTGESTGEASGVDAVVKNFMQAIRSAKELATHTVLVFHPWLLGQDDKRMQALEGLLEAARTDKDLWVSSCGQVAEWLLARSH